MEFRNHTPFPALAFEGIDQHDQRFHVVVLRQTLTWDQDGELHYADAQTPPCEVDTFFGAMNQSSVREESDLCHYKPRCDVIVNATAHASQGKPAHRFAVRLVVRRPDTPAPVPPPPQPLNPWMAVSDTERAQWQREVERAKSQSVPGKVLIDKTLTVTGPRQFRKRAALVRILQWAVKWGSLTLVRPNPWKLTRPSRTLSLPLRYEAAWGGQCRINARDNRHLVPDPKRQAKLQDSEAPAKRVPKKFRLRPEELAGHPDADGPDALRPVAHRVWEANPIGVGFAEQWFLEAARIVALPAPRIEHPTAPLTATHFWQAVRGKAVARQQPALQSLGLGIRAKAHPERRRLVGTVDQAFAEGEAALPEDFDFAVWNAAPPDQQTDYLQGDEVFELTNLCPPDTTGAVRDQTGQTVLRLSLPGHECFALVRLLSGQLFNHPLVIDTVSIDPDQRQLILTWRGVLAKDEAAPVRVLEARLRTLAERDALRQEIEAIKSRRLKVPQDPATVPAEVIHG